jgi:hypothetical protein
MELNMSSCPAPKESLWERDAFGTRIFDSAGREKDSFLSDDWLAE